MVIWPGITMQFYIMLAGYACCKLFLFIDPGAVLIVHLKTETTDLVIEIGRDSVDHIQASRST